MDWMHRTLNWIDHNRWTLAATALAAACLAGLIGCQPTTQGLFSDRPVGREQLEQQVLAGRENLATRRAQLQAEMEQFNARLNRFEQRVDLARSDLHHQEKLRAQMLALLGNAATESLAGNWDPRGFVVPALGLLGAAFGVGKTLDNRRKDRVIRQLKARDAP
jgi:hypothetical protein